MDELVAEPVFLEALSIADEQPLERSLFHARMRIREGEPHRERDRNFDVATR